MQSDAMDNTDQESPSQVDQEPRFNFILEKYRISKLKFDLMN